MDDVQALIITHASPTISKVPGSGMRFAFQPKVETSTQRPAPPSQGSVAWPRTNSGFFLGNFGTAHSINFL